MHKFRKNTQCILNFNKFTFDGIEKRNKNSLMGKVTIMIGKQ